MKRGLFYLLALVLVAGCQKPQWDFFNTDITIELRDGEGWNWFDGTRPGGNMRANDVTIDYKGETYDLVFLDPGTRAEPKLPLWEEDGRDPFRLKGYFETERDKIRLLFGEFSIDTQNYRGETFTINWGDGSASVVKFDLYSTSKGRKKEPATHQAIWVESGLGEGTRSDGALFLSIVKE